MILILFLISVGGGGGGGEQSFLNIKLVHTWGSSYTLETRYMDITNIEKIKTQSLNELVLPFSLPLSSLTSFVL